MKVLFFFILTSLSFKAYTLDTYSKVELLMGSKFEITIVAENQQEADKYIDIAINEIKRIEKLISSWDSNSQTSKINLYSGVQPVKVDNELFELIKRSLLISEITDGAFDISYGCLDKIWKFKGEMTQLPSDDQIKNALEGVGYQKIILNPLEQTVFLKTKGMKIGFGAIGKGYAADKVKQILIDSGVVAGIINASGDMNTWGKQPNGKYWQVAITNPLKKDNSFALFSLKQGAVVTSGNYEKFVILNGKKYTHIINPKTGYPVSGILSVSVFASSAELADALATSVFVMGVETGIDRINQLPNVECIIVDENGEIFKSNNIKINEE